MIVKTTPTKLGRAIGHVCAGAGLLAALLAVPAFADELADVSKLLRAGKMAEALGKTNDFLARHPADPQMRFMKGVLLTEQNKTDEAIAIFTKLTEDYKDLPEPYNNLAVLYASSGQYEKARIALEKAIRTNPSYMTAYENLGDVYGKLASQAYDKALALGTTTPPAKSKLTLLRTFSSSTGSKIGASAPDAVASAPAQASAPVKLVTPIPEQPKTVPMQRIPSMAVAPAAVASAPAAVAPKPAAAPVLATTAPAAVVPKPSAPPVLAATTPAPASSAPPAAPVVAQLAPKAEPPKAEPPKPAAPVAKPVPDNAERDELLSRVNGWAKAWSAQDVSGYLGYYSNDFAPPKGLARQAWADERRARIAGKGRIRVEVNAPQVVITGDTAKVTFRQVYESDRLSANSRKTLLMVKQGGKWQIKQELSGS
jgi:ketosteroid isomerase-like protein